QDCLPIAPVRPRAQVLGLASSAPEGSGAVVLRHLGLDRHRPRVVVDLAPFYRNGVAAGIDRADDLPILPVEEQQYSIAVLLARPPVADPRALCGVTDLSDRRHRRGGEQRDARPTQPR